MSTDKSDGTPCDLAALATKAAPASAPPKASPKTKPVPPSSASKTSPISSIGLSEELKKAVADILPDIVRATTVKATKPKAAPKGEAESEPNDKKAKTHAARNAKRKQHKEQYDKMVSELADLKAKFANKVADTGKPTVSSQETRPAQEAKAGAGKEATDEKPPAPSQELETEETPLQAKDLVAGWVKQYKIPAPRRLVDQWSQKTGIAFYPTDESPNGENSHALLAAYRTAATVYALAYLVKAGHTAIDILFYSHRDLNIVKNLNDYLIIHKAEPIMVYYIGGEVEVADYHRRVPTDHMAIGTAALLVDVYHGSVESNDVPITPKYFTSLHYDEALWVGHDFKEKFGVVDTAAWMVDEDNMVTWFSDEVNDSYARHPNPLDMVTPYADGFTAAHTIKIYQLQGKIVYRIVQVKASSIKTVQPVLSPPRTTWIKTGIADYSQLPVLARFLPGALRKLWPAGEFRIWVKVAHLKALEAELATKARTEWTWANFESSVKRILDADLEYVILERRFPDAFDGYRTLLGSAIFTDRIQKKADILLATGDAHGSALSQYNAARRAIAMPVDPFDSHKLVAVAGWICFGILCYYITRKYRFATASMLTWLTKRASDARQLDLTPVYARIRRVDPNTWDLFIQAWEARPGPANAGLKARLMRLMQSMSDRARNMHPSMAVNRALKSAVDRTFTPRLDSMITNVGETVASSACITAGLMARPDAGDYMNNIVLAPILEEGAKHLLQNQVWKVLTSAAIASGDVTQYAKPTLVKWYWHFMFHFVTANVPLTYAIPAHMMYNAFANSAGIPVMSSPQGAALATLAQVASALPLWDQLGSAPQVDEAEIRREGNQILGEFDRHCYAPDRENGPFHFDDQIWCDVEDFVGSSQITQSVTSRLFVPSVDCLPIVYPTLCKKTRMVNPPASPARKVNLYDGYWRAICHNAKMVKPAKSEHNMLNVVMYRLMKAVEEPLPYLWDLAYTAFSKGDFAIGPCTHCTHTAAHSSPDVSSFLSDLRSTTLSAAPGEGTFLGQRAEGDGSDTLDLGALFEKWFTHVEGKKRKLYQSTFAKIAPEGVSYKHRCVQQIQINIKTDEVLLKVADLNAPSNGAIPRPIHAVAPEVTVTVGPYVHAATERIKYLLNGYNILGRVLDYEVTLRFAAGATDLELSKWLTQALAADSMHGMITILAGGDDSLAVVRRPDGKVYYLIADLTACDQSIGLPALMFEWRVLYDLGVPVEVLQIMATNAAASLRCSVNNRDTGAMFVNRPPRRNTGGTDTTFGNTVCLLGAYLAIMLENVQNGLIGMPNTDQYVKSFKRFGLTIKMKIEWHDTPGFSPEFLKGWWFPVELPEPFITYVWTPLPSRLLKITKTMKNPMLTYSSLKPTTLREGLAIHLAAVAKGQLSFSQPPCMSAIYKGWLEAFPKVVNPWFEEDHPGKTHPGGMGLELSDALYLQAMVHRYGVTIEQLCSFFAVMAQVRAGELFYHPVWTALAADYA